MSQAGFFDFEQRKEQLDAHGNPLRLLEDALVEVLFDQFESDLSGSGFAASKGSLVDASIVEVPRHRNNREDNETIKDGCIPVPFVKKPCKQRQKDTDAQRTTKHQKRYFGYKNHINVDVKNKLIRQYSVTDAATHDSQVIDELLDENNTHKDVFGRQAQKRFGKLIRCIGIVRARAVIGLRNLVYNFDRYARLVV